MIAGGHCASCPLYNRSAVTHEAWIPSDAPKSAFDILAQGSVTHSAVIRGWEGRMIHYSGLRETAWTHLALDKRQPEEPWTGQAAASVALQW